MGTYSGVGAYLSSSGSEVGAISGRGLIQEWGLNQSFTVCNKYTNYEKLKVSSGSEICKNMKVSMVLKYVRL